MPGPDYGFVPYVVADRVVYSDVAPWPVSPDGTGDALKKLDSALYGNEPLNWAGGPPTPGAANFASATNRPPVLTAISDRSVHAGYAVAFNVIATDPDLPGQTLTFTLQGTVPAGATLNSSSGAFAWTPQANQIGSYPLTIRVSDNGSPLLSDTKSFSIAVLALPQVSSVTVSGGTVNIAWASYPGRRYRVETTGDLSAPNWVQVGADIIAGGMTSSVSVLGGTEQQRFYRVLSFDN